MSEQSTAHRTNGNVVANQFLDQLQSRKLFLWPNRCVGQPFAERQLLRFIPVSEQPVMSDLHKPFRQHMEQEAPDKFHGGQRHDFFFSAIGIIPPFECNLAISDIQDPVVGNGHPVSIPSKVMDHSGRITERRFAVCNPFLFLTAVYQVEEITGILILFRATAEIKIHCFQCCQELAAEYPG